jgi:hypothetical protein
MGILDTGDPQKNLTTGVIMMVVGFVQLYWIYTGQIFIIPYFREILLVIGAPSGIYLVILSRIQTKRERQHAGSASGVYDGNKEN